MIEDEYGSILVASELDDTTLGEFDIDEEVRMRNERDENADRYYIEHSRVDSERFDYFVNGEIDEGETPILAFGNVVNSLIMSRHPISRDLRERLRSVADGIEKLLDVEE